MNGKIVFCIICALVGMVLAQGMGVHPEKLEANPFLIVLDTLSLLLLLLTTFFGWELYKMMKGGQLATSWGFISVGIFTFSFGRLIQVGVSANFWEIPVWFPNVITFLVAIMLALGVFSQRKVLS
ncbi:hypothetical protein DRQ33_02510 [bacterium]|nr:MAG: hypothetical protein DRQ33_02510 [bacterium]